MDIISQLSDDLLLRILSYVPTKEVVATSLLSKRWRSLWMLVPQLGYIYDGGDYKSFSQYVYRSLLSNKAPVLEHLDLHLYANYPVIDSKLWLEIAISRHVRELEIDFQFPNGPSVTLPTSLYTSDTLETLILANNALLSVPSSVCLPSLKVLRLVDVNYVDEASLPGLLSGCPNLEELCVEQVDVDITVDATIVVPSLQRLIMSGVKFSAGGRYVIDVPSLKYLNIDDIVCNFRLIENMPELAEAYVDILEGASQKILRALTSVRRLSLYLPLSEVMCPSGMIFNQLVHLSLYTIAEGWWDLLTSMLKESPKLRFLKLIGEHDYYDLSGKETPIGWKPPSTVPECLLLSLEAFEWIGYKGRQGDREMATFVLKNAACLKKATFTPEYSDVGEKYQMLKELASVATASTSSQLLFN